MSMNDVLANVLNSIKTQRSIASAEAFARPTSKLVTECLKLMQKFGYIGEFEIIEDGRGGVYRIKLTHKFNDCGVIKPRFPVKVGEIEKWERRFLPAKNVGVLLISTPRGVIDQKKAIEKGVGGVLLGFVY